MADTEPGERPIPAPNADEVTALADDLFGIRKSVRYHDRRAVFFERLHRLTDLCAILLAGVVIMELLGNESPFAIKIFAGIGAFLAAVDLVVGFAKSADLHRNLKRRFILLEQKCASGFTADELRRERLGIEGDEPPVYRALDCLCVRELAVAEGYTKAECDRILAHADLHATDRALFLLGRRRGAGSRMGRASTEARQRERLGFLLGVLVKHAFPLRRRR